MVAQCGNQRATQFALWHSRLTQVKPKRQKILGQP